MLKLVPIRNEGPKKVLIFGRFDGQKTRFCAKSDIFNILEPHQESCQFGEFRADTDLDPCNPSQDYFQPQTFEDLILTYLLLQHPTS